MGAKTAFGAAGFGQLESGLEKVQAAGKRYFTPYREAAVPNGQIRQTNKSDAKTMKI